MKRILVLFALVLGCSGGSANSASDGPPRCLDLCGMNFAQCTERHPGDYTACADQRRDCDQECRAQEAEAEGRSSNAEILSPNDFQPQDSTSEPQETETAPDDTPKAE